MKSGRSILCTTARWQSIHHHRLRRTHQQRRRRISVLSNNRPVSLCRWLLLNEGRGPCSLVSVVCCLLLLHEQQHHQRGSLTGTRQVVVRMWEDVALVGSKKWSQCVCSISKVGSRVRGKLFPPASQMGWIYISYILTLNMMTILIHLDHIV